MKDRNAMEQRSLFQSAMLIYSGDQGLDDHLKLWRYISTCLFSSALVLCLLTGSFVSPLAVSVHADDTPVCTRNVLPVTLSPLNLTVYHVVGWLCYTGSLDQYQLVQLLVHGATYDHSYWDFPYQPGTYSYVKAMAKAGYATFNFDRIGNGESDHPLPELVTIQANAYVVHQLVRSLKTGSIEGHVFHKVLLAGHSVGSAISVAEAATYADVDGVLLTGFLHFVDPAVLLTLAADVYPAKLDPLFRNISLITPGYLTTKPNTRGRLFYYTPNADANVIATDEATKATITDAEFATFFSISNSMVSRRIQVPVLVAVGQYDSIFCLGTFSCTNTDTVKTYELPYYAPQAQLQVIVIPNAGHDLNLQINAPTDWYPQAIQWMHSTF
jgi:pimeloyl-ACP methyl ester carboxylesterase